MDARAHQNIVSFVFLSIFNCTAKDIGKIRIEKRELRMINVKRVWNVMILFVGIKFQSWVIEAHRAQRQEKSETKRESDFSHLINAIQMTNINKNPVRVRCVCVKECHNTQWVWQFS